MVTGPSLGGIVGSSLTLPGFGGAQAASPASIAAPDPASAVRRDRRGVIVLSSSFLVVESPASVARPGLDDAAGRRTEEHTSELQSRIDPVCRPLLDNENTHAAILPTPPLTTTRHEGT